MYFLQQQGSEAFSHNSFLKSTSCGYVYVAWLISTKITILLAKSTAVFHHANHKFDPDLSVLCEKIDSDLSELCEKKLTPIWVNCVKKFKFFMFMIRANMWQNFFIFSHNSLLKSTSCGYVAWLIYLHPYPLPRLWFIYPSYDLLHIGNMFFNLKPKF